MNNEPCARCGHCRGDHVGRGVRGVLNAPPLGPCLFGPKCDCPQYIASTEDTDTETAA